MQGRQRVDTLVRRDRLVQKKQELVTKGLAVHAKEFAFCPYSDGRSL